MTRGPLQPLFTTFYFVKYVFGKILVLLIKYEFSLSIFTFTWVNFWSTFSTSAFDHQDITVSLNTNPVITKAYNLIKGRCTRPWSSLLIQPSCICWVSTKQTWSKTNLLNQMCLLMQKPALETRKASLCFTFRCVPMFGELWPTKL